MTPSHDIPKITLCFDVETDPTHYEKTTAMHLAKILPKGTFSKKISTHEKEQFQLLLPLVKYSLNKTADNKISFTFLAKYRSNSFKFFFEMISQWLVTGKRLNVLMVFAVDFQMPDVSDEIYTMGDITVETDDKTELQQILAKLPLIESEILLGLESSYNARRILESKGLPLDEKNNVIHEHLSKLIKRLPKTFDQDVFIEVQHVLILCRAEFKAARTARHLVRIIAAQYLFRKALRQEMKGNPEKRHLKIKLYQSKIETSKAHRNILCVMISISFLRNNELLEKKHLLKAIKKVLPDVQAVENSFFIDKRSMESISTLYIEVEKADNLAFTQDDLKLLRDALPKDLKANIEHLMHPIFMPCNEEEIMRNILSLSHEIRYSRDLPQVIITFNEQTHVHLNFTIILVRLLYTDSKTGQELFKNGKGSLNYIYNRSKTVGYLRKKYPKEALVFHVNLSKESFLRNDHSIDLYKARHSIVADLSSSIGEFRDFNGGMISKQNELLNSLKDILGDIVKYDECLLENFFFSLMPVTMRSLLEPEAFKTLFLMLLNTIECGFSANSNYRIQQDLDFIFILVAMKANQQKDELHKAIHKFSLHSTELAYTAIKTHDIFYEGYIYRCDEPSKQQQFLQVVQSVLH